MTLGSWHGEVHHFKLDLIQGMVENGLPEEVVLGRELQEEVGAEGEEVIVGSWGVEILDVGEEPIRRVLGQLLRHKVLHPHGQLRIGIRAGAEQSLGEIRIARIEIVRLLVQLVDVQPDLLDLVALQPEEAGPQGRLPLLQIQPRDEILQDGQDGTEFRSIGAFEDGLDGVPPNLLPRILQMHPGLLEDLQTPRLL